MHTPSDTFVELQAINQQFIDELLRVTKLLPGEPSPSVRADVRKIAVTELPPVSLWFRYDANYPESAPPQFFLDSPWIGKQLADKARAHMRSMFEELGGGIIVFDWVDWLKEGLVTQCEKKPVTSDTGDAHQQVLLVPLDVRTFRMTTARAPTQGTADPGDGSSLPTATETAEMKPIAVYPKQMALTTIGQGLQDLEDRLESCQQYDL